MDIMSPIYIENYLFMTESTFPSWCCKKILSVFLEQEIYEPTYKIFTGLSAELGALPV